MPELPEVETVRRTLENFILNKKMNDISFLDILYKFNDIKCPLFRYYLKRGHFLVNILIKTYT